MEKSINLLYHYYILRSLPTLGEEPLFLTSDKRFKRVVIDDSGVDNEVHQRTLGNPDGHDVDIKFQTRPLVNSYTSTDKFADKYIVGPNRLKGEKKDSVFTSIFNYNRGPILNGFSYIDNISYIPGWDPGKILDPYDVDDDFEFEINPILFNRYNTKTAKGGCKGTTTLFFRSNFITLPKDVSFKRKFFEIKGGETATFSIPRKPEFNGFCFTELIWYKTDGNDGLSFKIEKWKSNYAYYFKIITSKSKGLYPENPIIKIRATTVEWPNTVSCFERKVLISTKKAGSGFAHRIVDLPIPIQGQNYFVINEILTYHPNGDKDMSWCLYFEPLPDNSNINFQIASSNASGSGSYVEAEARIMHFNTRPNARNLAINPPAPKTLDDLVGSYIYSDPDGDSETHTQIRWYKDGIYQPEFTNKLKIPAKATAKGQSWYFKVWPHDGISYGFETTSPTIRIINSPPVASDLSVSPSKPLDTEDLKAIYQFSDLDGDSENGTEIKWYKNGVHQPECDNVNPLPASATIAGEYWHFTIKPNDGEDFGTLQTSEAVPIDMKLIINTENMEGLKSWFGTSGADGVRLTHQDHPIYLDIEFPADFIYYFTIRAKGEMAGGASPWMKVQIGNEFKGACEIPRTEWEDYTFVTSLSAGVHRLYLSFLNDWWNPYVGDRNLLINKVNVSCYFDSLSTKSFVYEAEKMSHHNHAQIDSIGNYIVLDKYYSYIAHTMYFEQHNLDFEIIAKADSSNNGWPEMELWIDNDVISLTVDNVDATSYLFTITDIPGGEHRIKIDLKNDSWLKGRNLYIDKLIIHNRKGGLLKPGTDELPNARENTNVVPDAFALHQNYPNPFNPETYISYQIPEASSVTIKIYNLLGEEIKTLVNDIKQIGYYTVKWDGKDNLGNNVGSGIYLCQIRASNYNCMKKMTLIK